MKITKIQQQKYHPKLYSIFIDGEYAFHLHRDVLAKLNLQKGQQVNKNQLTKIIKQEQKNKAQEYAFLLLSHRDRSHKEIHNRLKRKQFEEDIIEEVIKKLKSEGFIDDYKFAKNWINQRIKEKPRGKKLIQQELMQKGIDKKIIEETIAENFSPDAEEEIELAKRALQKKLHIYKKLDTTTALRRIQNFLLRRGFSYDVIQKIARNLFKNQDFID